MLLIGMFDSPFVRRVAISMKLLGITFEHANWSVGKDFDKIRQYNPLGRVPILVLDSGESLIESAAILDYLDDLVGPQRALLPCSGESRRDALRLMAIAIGAAEKGVSQIYERAFRPEEKRHQPWVDRCRTQMLGAVAELERAAAARRDRAWFLPDGISQVDITSVCVFTFLQDAVKLPAESYPSLQALGARCEAMPEFIDTRLPFYTPG